MTPSVSLLPQPHIPLKPVVISPKRASTWGKALTWINSPEGFKKTTETLATVATLTVIAGAVAYFFGPSQQPHGSSTKPNNSTSDGFCAKDNPFDFLDDKTCIPTPEGYFNLQGGKTCPIPFATSQNTSSFTNTSSFFYFGNKTAHSIPDFVNESSIPSNNNETTDQPTQNFTFSNFSSENVTTFNQDQLKVNETDSESPLIDSNVKEEFVASEFCHRANHTTIEAFCKGIFDGRVILPSPEVSLSNLKDALDHVYTSINSSNHDVICSATKKFWEGHIYPGFAAPFKSKPTVALLDPHVSESSAFIALHQAYLNDCERTKS